jgi:hypothetical protein
MNANQLLRLLIQPHMDNIYLNGAKPATAIAAAMDRSASEKPEAYQYINSQ